MSAVSDISLMIEQRKKNYQPVGFSSVSKKRQGKVYSKDKVHEGSKLALSQKLMKFCYIVCVCLP